MEVILKSSTQRVQKEVSNSFTWYDHHEKKMVNLQGGYLNFNYDYKTKRMVPDIKTCNSYSYQNNFVNIQKWVKDNIKEFEFDVVEFRQGYSITINVDDNKFDDIFDSLIKNRIAFDYD